jgi:hypothetical protein
MTRYFIAANVWLIFAGVVFFGRTFVYEGPDRPNVYSFFGRGPRFDSGSYTLIVFVLLAVSAFFFFLTWKTRKKL